MESVFETVVEEKPEEESTLTSKTFGLEATPGLCAWLGQGRAGALPHLPLSSSQDLALSEAVLRFVSSSGQNLETPSPACLEEAVLGQKPLRT